VLADSKILIAGTVNGVDLGVTRLNVDGSLDLSFGSNGVSTRLNTSSPEIFSDMQIAEDEKIEGWRLECQRLGVIYPIVYAPWPRQAYNWLYKASEESGQLNDDNRELIEKRFERLVLTYGGLVVCHIFQKEEHKIKKKILNWRTGYFFEKLIFDIYTIDQVLKIKKQELAKTNPTLVKKIQN
jgi:hypothetical protein